MNRAIITGNLTRDSELRSTAGGMAVLGFGVAVNDRRKNQQTGEWEDYPNFIDCTMFGTRAESISRYLNKGTKVSIEGKLRWSQWEREGQKRSKIEVIVDEIEWNNPQQNAQQAPSAPVYAPQQGYSQQAPIQPQYAPQAAAPAPGYAPQAYAPQPPQYQQTALGYAQQPVSQPAVQAAPQATYQANAQAPYQANRQASAHVPQPAPAVASAQVQQVALADEDIPF
ncbi:MAG: single-stranded DNA-binding protein [Gordonibacter sp.]